MAQGAAVEAGVPTQIKRTLSRPENLELVRQMLDVPEPLLRSRLADDVCQRFGFFNAIGYSGSSLCQ